ncbi:MAG: hypothetical protein WBB45_02660 [Cyclobacteriaceae bacterium]
MADREKYPSHLLLLLIRTSAAYKDYKLDFAGLRKLAHDVVEDPNVKKDFGEIAFDEKYLNKKYKLSAETLSSRDDVPAARSKILSLLTYNMYGSFRHFSEKAEALFNLFRESPIAYNISAFSEDDQRLFIHYLSDQSQSYLVSDPKEEAVLSIYYLGDEEGPSGTEQDQLWLKDSVNAGETSGTLLTDRFPIAYVAIALDIYLQLPDTQERIHELEEPDEKETTPSAMRYLPVLSPPHTRERSQIWKRAFIGISAALAALLIVYLIFLQPEKNYPSHDEILDGIAEREHDMNALVRQTSYRSGRMADTLDSTHGIIWVEAMFDSTDTYYRNYYGFTNGYKSINFKKNISKAIETDLDQVSPFNQYGFQKPVMTEWINIYDDPDTIVSAFEIAVGLAESVTSDAEILVQRPGRSGEYIVTVRYRYPIRYLSINYQFGKETDYYKIRTCNWVGFMPEEDLIFRKTGSYWQYVGVAP